MTAVVLALAALLTYETHAVTPDGVTRDATYQEKLVRDGTHVWMERVLPVAAPVTSGHEIDLVRLAKHVQEGKGGAATVELVSTREKLIVDLRPADYERVELSGRWDEAAHLVAPSSLAELHDTGVKVGGARWLERKQGDEYVRVLWSDALAFPLEIERGRTDGTRRTRVRAKIVPAPRELPWTALDGYRRKDLTDFGD